MKKLSKTLFLFFLSLNMLGVPFGFSVIQSQNLTSVEAKAKNLGSAKKLKGNTIIISIFTNDKQTKWNIKKKEDTIYMSNTLKDLRIATTWISTKAKKYKTTSKFVYDWSKNKDLKYNAVFKNNLIEPYGAYYHKQIDYIKKNIKINALKKKYKADNVIFMFFFNTTHTKNDVRSWTYSTICDSSIYYEITNIYNYFDDGNFSYFTPAATYAHEILHSFGAPDLYYSNSMISQKYVNYLKNIGSQDIMYTVNLGDKITCQFTELDAYYTGLKKSAKDVKKWNLGKSEHF